MNAEFQRIARRDKKAFLSDQCKEIEENNRMGKIRDLFKKIRDTKGTFHAKMGSIKDRNVRDLTEAEDIKKRWQEYAEELYKRDLHDPHNHDEVITNMSPLSTAFTASHRFWIIVLSFPFFKFPLQFFQWAIGCLVAFC